MIGSPIDIALVFGAALLLFGPKKLPELGHSLGKSIGNFKRAMQDAGDEITSSIKTEPAAKPAPGTDTVTVEPQPSTPGPAANSANTATPDKPEK
jgi:sec-independent protein translocase protein TatA